MGLPEEDRGPVWLRDWGKETGHTDLDSFSGYVDPDALAVDITTLVAFADSLQAEHEQDYRPHVREVLEKMCAAPAQPDARFIELTESMTHHYNMLSLTSTALANHDKAIIAFVAAARAITSEYRSADALSAASVSDVETNLTAPPTAAPQTVTPQQATAQTNTPVTTTTTTTTTAPVTATTTDAGAPDGGRDL